MIKNGPKMRLNSAPGRRTTSVTSLPTNAVVRVQLLSGPSSSSFMLLCAFCLAPMLVRTVFGAFDQGREHFVKGGSIFTAGLDSAAGGPDRFDHARRGRCGILGDHQHLARRALANLADAGQVLEDD